MSENPTKYDAVRVAYAARAQAKRQHIQENRDFASSIAHGFVTFMGMPKSYKVEKDQATTYQHYTPMYSIENEEMVEVSHWIDAITHYSDGTFDFGLGIVLEPSEDSWPKEIVRSKVKCKRKKDSILVEIADEEVEVSFDGSESPEIDKVHDLIFALLNKYLDSRWGDSDPKVRIGFLTA